MIRQKLFRKLFRFRQDIHSITNFEIRQRLSGHRLLAYIETPHFHFFKFLLFSMFPHPNTCFPLKSVRSLNSLLLVSGFSHFHVCNYADTVSTYMLVVNKYADTKSVPSINNTDTCQHSQRLCGHTFSECIHSCWLFVFSNTVLYLKENENFCKTAFAFSYGAHILLSFLNIFLTK